MTVLSAGPDPGVRPITAPSLTIRVRAQSGAIVVTPTGALDLRSVAAFARCLRRVQVQSADVVLDLRALTFLDASGARALHAAQRRSVSLNGGLEVVCADGQVRQMLRLSGFDRATAIVEPLGSLDA